MPTIHALPLFLSALKILNPIHSESSAIRPEPPEVRLKDVRVVFLLATDCPISRQYVPFIRDFSEDWNDKGLGKISLVFCNGPKRGHRIMVRGLLREFGIDLPWRTDPNNRYAHSKGARVVPEVLVFQSGQLLYSGAIDDMFAGLGLRRPVTSEHYLDAALEAIRNGRIPEPARRPAFGCLIE